MLFNPRWPVKHSGYCYERRQRVSQDLKCLTLRARRVEFPSMSKSPITRRRFLKSSSAVASRFLLPAWDFTETQVRATTKKRFSPNDKLNLGIIGAGGRGGENLKVVSTENIIALCHVDEVNAAASFKKFPDARRYQDFRVMLEKEKSLDPVVVSTPDHIHAIAAAKLARPA